MEHFMQNVWAIIMEVTVVIGITYFHIIKQSDVLCSKKKSLIKTSGLFVDRGMHFVSLLPFRLNALPRLSLTYSYVSKMWDYSILAFPV